MQGRGTGLKAGGGVAPEWFRVKVNGTEFSLSGVQNQVQAYRETGASEAETAYFALRSVVEAVKKATRNAQKAHPLPVLFSGGVASNSLLRRQMPEAIFGEPRYSTDNALGIAVLTWLQYRKQNSGNVGTSIACPPITESYG